MCAASQAIKYTISVLAFFSAKGLAPSEVVEYKDPELHCSITFPEGWQRLPSHVANRAVQALTFQAGVPSRTFLAWYQRGNAPEGTHPFLLISRQIGRMPALRELAADIKQQTKTAPERWRADNPKLFHPVIDPRRRMVAFETEQTVNLNDTGKVYGKCCLFPGKLGVAELFEQGFQEVYALRGGLDAWQAAGGPVEPK